MVREGSSRDCRFVFYSLRNSIHVVDHHDLSQALVHRLVLRRISVDRVSKQDEAHERSDAETLLFGLKVLETRRMNAGKTVYSLNYSTREM